MFGLQELFDKQIEEQLRPNELGVCILENGLEEIGVFITDIQRFELEAQFSKLSCTQQVSGPTLMHYNYAYPQ